jgi:hypothetical protein
MKEVIWPNLQALAALRRIVNSSDDLPKNRQRKRKRT